MGSVARTNNMPCAACRILRRRCTKDCILLPYFPPTEPDKFVAVHRVFGASNVCKMLQEVPVDDRGDAVTSMVYEAKARLRDPVYGCLSFIASLQRQVSQLESELNAALAEAMTLRTHLYEALYMAISAHGSPSTDIAISNQNYRNLQLSEGGNHTSDVFPQFVDSVEATGEPLLPNSWC